MKNLFRVTPREAYAAYIMGSVLVDLRDSRDAHYKAVNLKNLVSLPFSELDKRYRELPGDKPVMLLSGIGNKGRVAAHFLLEKGYTNIALVDGGMRAWEEEGLPV